MKEKTDMDQQDWIITFNNVSPDEASQYASELKTMLLDASPDIKVIQRPSNKYAQGWEEIVISFLSGGAAVALINVIGIWITQGYGRSINIEDSDFKFQAKGLTRKEYEATRGDLLKHLQEGRSEESD